MTPNKTMIVKKANALVDAQYELSLNESRLLLYCVAQIKPITPMEKDQMFFVDAAGFAGVFGLEVKGVYQTMKTAMNRLGERWVRITDQSGHPKDIRWIVSKQYFSREGMVGLQFHNDMIPFISELTKRFTQYDISAISRMHSSYGIPIFELLSKRRDLNEQTFSVDFLRQKLCLGSKYSRWAEFKRNVLDPAVKDLNADKGEFHVQYETVKTGRTVTSVRFHYKPRSRPSVEDAFESKEKASGNGKDSRSAPQKIDAQDLFGDHSSANQIPPWKRYGYRSANEYAEAVKLSSQVDFDVTDVQSFLRARTFGATNTADPSNGAQT